MASKRFKDFGGKESLTEFIIDKTVYGTIPVTPGLVITIHG